jgi:murein tripeptide amidase MpaA
MSYLNLAEIDSALAGLAQQYPSLCELVTLPNPTFEGRTSYALRIGRKTSLADAVLFTACQHAREWGGADICVYFAADLLEAYTLGTGLTYGGKQFSSLSIRRVVERLNVVVFPCVNPDGREYDQQDPSRLWRKNRNPAQSGGDPARVGVDLNRNHSLLWDFRTKFHPQANPGTVASDDPVSDIYHGPAPDSEPETQNVHWLLDTHRFVRWHMDIHSFTGDVLFLWGDDTDQTTDWSMNFLNPGYDGQRGVTGGYGEYIPTKDRALVGGTAQRVVDAVNAVRGGHYEAKQSVFLSGTGTSVTYPVSGAIDDYSYSRHRVDCTRRKVYAFTVEFGYWTGDYQTSFHPPWPEMQQIVGEIDAGMVEFCVAAIPTFTWPWPWLFRRLWPWQIWEPMVRVFGRWFGPILQRFVNRAPG